MREFTLRYPLNKGFWPFLEESDGRNTSYFSDMSNMEVSNGILVNTWGFDLKFNLLPETYWGGYLPQTFPIYGGVLICTYRHVYTWNDTNEHLELLYTLNAEGNPSIEEASETPWSIADINNNFKLLSNGRSVFVFRGNYPNYEFFLYDVCRGADKETWTKFNSLDDNTRIFIMEFKGQLIVVQYGNGEKSITVPCKIFWGKVGDITLDIGSTSEAGYKLSEYVEEAKQIKVLGNDIILYGNNAISVLSPREFPAVFGEDLISYMGVNEGVPVCGSDREHYIATKIGDVYRLSSDGLTWVGHRSRLEGESSIAASYDPVRERAYLSGLTLGNGGQESGDWDSLGVRSVCRSEGVLYAVTEEYLYSIEGSGYVEKFDGSRVDKTVGDTVTEYGPTGTIGDLEGKVFNPFGEARTRDGYSMNFTTCPFDMGFNAGKTIYGVELHGEWDTNPTIIGQIKYKSTIDSSWATGGAVTLAAGQNFIPFIQSGVVFKIVISISMDEAPTFNPSFNMIIIRYKVTDKEFLHGWQQPFMEIVSS